MFFRFLSVFFVLGLLPLVTGLPLFDHWTHKKVSQIAPSAASSSEVLDQDVLSPAVKRAIESYVSELFKANLSPDRVLSSGDVAHLRDTVLDSLKLSPAFDDVASIPHRLNKRELLSVASTTYTYQTERVISFPFDSDEATGRHARSPPQFDDPSFNEILINCNDPAAIEYNYYHDIQQCSYIFPENTWEQFKTIFGGKEEDCPAIPGCKARSFRHGLTGPGSPRMCFPNVEFLGSPVPEHAILPYDRLCGLHIGAYTYAYDKHIYLARHILRFNPDSRSLVKTSKYSSVFLTKPDGKVVFVPPVCMAIQTEYRTKVHVDRTSVQVYPRWAYPTRSLFPPEVHRQCERPVVVTGTFNITPVLLETLPYTQAKLPYYDYISPSIAICYRIDDQWMSSTKAILLYRCPAPSAGEPHITFSPSFFDPVVEFFVDTLPKMIMNFIRSILKFLISSIGSFVYGILSGVLPSISVIVWGYMGRVCTAYGLVRVVTGSHVVSLVIVGTVSVLYFVYGFDHDTSVQRAITRVEL